MGNLHNGLAGIEATGKTLLLVVVTTNCGYCPSLYEQLTSLMQKAPYKDQYSMVPLVIKSHETGQAGVFTLGYACDQRVERADGSRLRGFWAFLVWSPRANILKALLRGDLSSGC